MNTSIVRYTLGHVLKLEGLLMLLPLVISLIYHESNGIYFLIVAAASLVIGILLSFRKPKDTVIYLKEGCIITSLSWIIMSIAGCLPFFLSGSIPDFTNALFETISGFTTTGASILSDIESLDNCMLFWRSFTHWIGGMGVLVFLLAIIPMGGGSNMNLMRAESPGPSVGKLVPKVRYTARILYIIYFGLTVLEIVLLLCGGLNLFDAVTTGFETAGTGGFSTKNDSLMSYSAYAQWVVAIFMILFGVNFNAYYLILFGDLKKSLTMEEVKHYFLVILVAVTAIFLNIVNTIGDTWTALRHSVFQVASIMSTTGFTTADFDTWSQAAKSILILLMFTGACAGSTAGGVKMSRFVVLFKTLGKELNSYIHPKSVKKIKMDGKPIEHEVVRSINVYFVSFMLILAGSVLIISLEGHDLVTNFTSVLACLNNVGPGLSKVGPSQNFAFFGNFSKYILMLDMLAGRLELFPLLILFHPSIWKEIFHKRILIRHKKNIQ